MTIARATIWFWIFCIGCVPATATAMQSEQLVSSKPTDGAEGRKNAEPPSAVDRIMEVCNLIATRHIDPPVKQQLVLAAAKSILETQKKDTPRGLSERISKLSSSEEFAALLESMIAEGGAVKADMVIEDLLLRIPGGGTLVGSEEARVGAQVAANQYVGVGIALSMESGQPVITTSFYGGPGYKAGVKNQDVILKIDGNSTAGKTLGEVVTELRGEAGTDVTMLLKHPTAGERELVVTRNVTFIPTVHGASQDEEGKWNYRLPTQPDVAFFRLNSFGASTVHELRKLDSELAGESLEGIILDLRRGGGTLHNVLMVADQFLEAGMVGSTIIGETEAKYETEDGCLFDGVPMVVLTAKTSSASSVFLAAALQDRGRAVLVGEPTNGVSYVRSQVDLANGDKVIIPTGYIRRGNGTKLFTRQHPLLVMQREREMVQPDFDRKSANLVVPDHLLLDEDDSDGEHTATADRVVGKAAAVLKQAK